MSGKRLIVTEHGLCWVPESDDGIPAEEVYPAETLPSRLSNARFYETPQGYVLGKPLDAVNDEGSRKPILFPSRQEQIQRHDAEFLARLEEAYRQVRITAQPMRFFGEFQSGIEWPDVAAEDVRARLMHHFPEGPGTASIAQKAAIRYARALQRYLERDGVPKPKISELARRWGMFCHDHGNAERDYYQAGCRPALVDPYAIDFSQVQLTDAERKAAWKDRHSARTRDDAERGR
jgi:hypothetical protein